MFKVSPSHSIIAFKIYIYMSAQLHKLLFSSIIVRVEGQTIDIWNCNKCLCLNSCIYKLGFIFVGCKSCKIFELYYVVSYEDRIVTLWGWMLITTQHLARNMISKSKRQMKVLYWKSSLINRVYILPEIIHFVCLDNNIYML